MKCSTDFSKRIDFNRLTEGYVATALPELYLKSLSCAMGRAGGRSQLCADILAAPSSQIRELKTYPG